MAVASGVYVIYSKVNQRRYVGSSINIPKRWTVHRSELRKNVHHSPHLQRAWDKYGEDAFEFVVLEECAIEQLIEREQHFFEVYEYKYNCAPVAESRLGYKHTPEARANMSAAQRGNKKAAGHVKSPETRAKTSAANTGRKLSSESRAKISESLLGNKRSEGYTHTPATRSKMSAALMGNKRNVGRKASPEARANMSAAQKTRQERNRAYYLSSAIGDTAPLSSTVISQTNPVSVRHSPTDFAPRSKEDTHVS